MDSVRDTPKGGLPHSDIRGSTIARISPRLFAACHVLHRLLAPRHPPDALIALEIRPPCAGRSTSFDDRRHTDPVATECDGCPLSIARMSAPLARIAPDNAARTRHRTISTMPKSTPRARRAGSREGLRPTQGQSPNQRRHHPGGGGGERDRTDDLLLAKQALSQLSYAPKPDASCSTRRLPPTRQWWAGQDLNLRPHAYQACALTS